MMNAKKFKKYLMLYGSDISCWPGDIRQAATAACEASTEFQELKRTEASFENLLRLRETSEPNEELAQRIISSLGKQPVAKTLGDFFNLEEFANLLVTTFASPKSVITFAIILIFGIMIGYTSPFFTDFNTTELDVNIELVEFIYDSGDYL